MLQNMALYSNYETVTAASFHGVQSYALLVSIKKKNFYKGIQTYR